MKAVVKEIQVGGFYNVESLEDACKVFLKENVKRTKIHFTIQCPDGKVRFITIRDEDGGTVAYGNFEGLPSFLDYAKDVRE